MILTTRIVVPVVHDAVAEWQLLFVYDKGLNSINVICYGLVTKPTKRQVRKLRKQFIKGITYERI